MKIYISIILTLFISCKVMKEVNSDKSVSLNGSISAISGFPLKVCFSYNGFDSIKPFFDSNPLERLNNNCFILEAFKNEKNSFNEDVIVHAFNKFEIITYTFPVHFMENEPIGLICNDCSIGDTLTVNFLRAQEGIIGTFSARRDPCNVIRFRFNIIRNDAIFFSEEVLNSPLFSNTIKLKINSMEKDDILLINEITLNCIKTKNINAKPIYHYIK